MDAWINTKRALLTAENISVAKTSVANEILEQQKPAIRINRSISFAFDFNKHNVPPGWRYLKLHSFSIFYKMLGGIWFDSISQLFTEKQINILSDIRLSASNHCLDFYERQENCMISGEHLTEINYE